MNTNGLAKLYDRLTPKERLPLILAASARGDEAERDRLSRSAPRVGFWLPDYHGLGEGMLLASLFHLLELLDVAALYWQTGGILAEWEQFSEGEEDAPTKKLRRTNRAFAYVFTTKLEGWRRFCSEFKADPEVLMNGLPGYDTVKRTEEAARIMACTPEEANAFMREKGGETAKALTVETVVASLWAFVNSRVEFWG
jgi:hypothetical protein